MKNCNNFFFFIKFYSAFNRYCTIDVFKIEISIFDICRKIKQRFCWNAIFILTKTKKNFTCKQPDCYEVTWHATLTSRDTHVVDVASSRHVLHSKKRKWKFRKESRRDIYVHKCISSFKNIYIIFFFFCNFQPAYFPFKWKITTIYTFFINLIFITKLNTSKEINVIACNWYYCHSLFILNQAQFSLSGRNKSIDLSFI